MSDAGFTCAFCASFISAVAVILSCRMRDWVGTARKRERKDGVRKEGGRQGGGEGGRKE